MATLPSLPGLPTLSDETPSPPLAQLAVLNGPDDGRDGKDLKDVRWFHPDAIDGRRWDQTFPYQLLVLDRQDDGTYRRRGDWRFTLPVPPEAVTLDLPFAAGVQATQGGIVEEIGDGAPIRPIEISGSFGVLPARPAAGQPPRAGLAASVFAGTIAAAQRTFGALEAVASDLTGDQREPTNLIPDDLLDDQAGADTLLRNTGYYQTRLMVRFLEAYLNLRRSPRGRNAVLAFAVWKEEAVYLVTPNRAKLRKDASSPMEQRYQILLTAWGRVKLDGPGATTDRAAPDAGDPSVLARALNALQDARLVLQDARATIEAVVADADRVVFEPIREAILLTKDALAVPLALVDLPAAIVRDAADTFVAAVAAGRDVLDFGSTLEAEKAATKASVAEDLRRIKDLLAPGVRDRTSAQTGLGRPGLGQAFARRPSLDVFDRPEAHPAFLSAVRVDRLDLPPVVQSRVQAEVARVKALSRQDLVTRRDSIVAASVTFEDLVGAGDATLNRTFGRPAPAPARPLTDRTFAVAAALTAATTAYAAVAARGGRTADAGPLAALRTYGDLASASGVPFVVPTSKFPVPLPYGTTLEQLALRYLGSPDRVGEIVALNGLRAPYVDEEGFRLLLLAPAFGRVAVVADTPDLHVGQTVWLESDAQPRTKRRIAGLDRRNGQATLTLEGDPDLDRYTTLQNAVLHAFLPGTVNSQTLVFVPSSSPPDGAFRVSGVAPAVVFDPLLSASGVDLLLTPDNDLVVTPDGDGRWAVGLAGLAQIFRILVELRRGTLLYHPDKGVPLRVGESVADVSAADAARAIRQSLSSDPSFGLVRSASVSLRPPVARVDVQVEVAGTGLTLPLSVQMTR